MYPPQRKGILQTRMFRLVLFTGALLECAPAPAPRVLARPALIALRLHSVRARCNKWPNPIASSALSSSRCPGVASPAAATSFTPTALSAGSTKSRCAHCARLQRGRDRRGFCVRLRRLRRTRPIACVRSQLKTHRAPPPPPLRLGCVQLQTASRTTSPSQPRRASGSAGKLVRSGMRCTVSRLRSSSCAESWQRPSASKRQRQSLPRRAPWLVPQKMSHRCRRRHHASTQSGRLAERPSCSKASS